MSFSCGATKTECLRLRIVLKAVCNEEKVGTSAFLPELRAQGVAHIDSTLAGGFSSDLANEETLFMLTVGSRLGAANPSIKIANPSIKIANPSDCFIYKCHRVPTLMHVANGQSSRSPSIRNALTSRVLNLFGQYIKIFLLQGCLFYANSETLEKDIDCNCLLSR